MKLHLFQPFGKVGRAEEKKNLEMYCFSRAVFLVFWLNFIIAFMLKLKYFIFTVTEILIKYFYFIKTFFYKGQ